MFNASNYCSLACCRAVLSQLLRDANPSESNEQADRAMGCLRKAIDAGYNDLKLLKTDKDLDSLRNRDDFRALVTRLEQRI